MPLPPDIDQRIQKAKANGFTDAQIQADIQRKYGESPGALASERPKTGAEKVGDFLGVGDFGRGLGSALAQGSGDVRGMKDSQAQLRSQTERLVASANKKPQGDPRRAEMLRIAQRNYALLGETADDAIEDAPSNREFLTSAAATGLNLAAAGTMGAKAAGRGVLGTTRYGIQPLKVASAQSAGLAGGLTGLREYGSGKSAGESARAAVGPAVLAGGLTGLIGLAGKGIAKALQKGPERLYERSVPLRTAKDTEKVIRGKATPVYGEALKRGIRGSSRQVLQQSTDAVDDIERQIQEAVAPRVPVNAQDKLFGAEVTADLAKGGAAKIAKAAEELTGLQIDTTKHTPLLQDFLEQTKVALRKPEREAMERALTGRISQNDALTVRRVIDKYLPKNAYGLDLPNSAKTVALLDAANDLRGQIAQVNPKAGKLLTQQSQMIRLRDAAGGLAAKETRRAPLSRVDALLGGGAAASFAFGNPLLGTALVGLPLARAATASPAIATRAAYFGSRAAPALSRAAQRTDGLRRLIRAGIISGSSQ